MAPCALAFRPASGSASTLSAPAITILRLVMIPRLIIEIPSVRPALSLARAPRSLNMPSGAGSRTPRHWQKREVVLVPLACQFRPPAHEGIFDRLGLADDDLQSEKYRRDRRSPFVKAKFA